MTGKEILEEEFERAGMRGYRADQVDAFLQKVAAYVDEQEAARSDLTYKMQILAGKIEEYKKDEENIREALLGAQKLGNSILSDARAKAETMTREAKATSDEMLTQAKAKVDAMTKDSLQKVNLELSALKRECDVEQRRYEMLKQEVSSFRASILKQYKAHLDLLSNLPTQENKLSTPPPREAAAKEEASAGSEDAERMEPSAETATASVAAGETEVNVPASAVEAETGVSQPKEVCVSSEIAPEDTDTRQEMEQAEQAQTKEFTPEHKEKAIGPSVGGSSEKTDNGVRKTPRPNFIEKFGELKFGGFGENE